MSKQIPGCAQVMGSWPLYWEAGQENLSRGSQGWDISEEIRALDHWFFQLYYFSLWEGIRFWFKEV